MAAWLYKTHIPFTRPFVSIVEHCVLRDLTFGHKGHEECTKNTKSLRIITALCCFFIITQTMTAQVRLPRLIRDSMILQRDSKINVWGDAWALLTIHVRHFPLRNSSIHFRFNESIVVIGKLVVGVRSVTGDGPSILIQLLIDQLSITGQVLIVFIHWQACKQV